MGGRGAQRRRRAVVRLVSTRPSEPPALTEDQIKALLLAFAALLVLGVVAVGLALAAQDEAEERQILEAVGAPPARCGGPPR